jgi:hypothetical protein
MRLVRDIGCFKRLSESPAQFLRSHQKMGYKIIEPVHFFGGKSMRQEHLFL